MEDPVQYCTQPGCSQLVSRGRCVRHAVQQEHARPDYAVRRWYRTVRWSRLRLIVLGLCAYTCASCGHVQAQLEIDHIRPHHGNRSLFWNPQNLQALCPPCHTRKTMRDTAEMGGG